MIMRFNILLFTAWLGTAASKPCTDLVTEQTRTDRDGRGAPESSLDEMRVVIGSNQLLRFYNNQVFSGWTLASEYMSQLQHHLMVQRFAAAGEPGWLLQFAETPYTKNVQLALVSNGYSVERLSAALIRARSEAADEIVRMIYEPTSGAAVTTSSQSSLVWQKPNIEAMIKIPQLSSQDSMRLKQILKRQFPDPGVFRRQLKQNYAIGIGHNELDAQFAAKLSAHARTGGHPIIEFSLARFSAVLDGIANQQRNLGEKFNQLSDEQLFLLFTKLRKRAYNSDPANLELIAAEVNELGFASASSEFALRLSRYVRTLNFLDYLPREWFTETEGASVGFDRLGKAHFLIYADIRGLGAANLLQLHKQSSVLRTRVMEIRKLDELLLANISTDRQDLLAKREQSLLELNEIRTNILASSNERVQEVQAWVKTSLNQAAISDRDFAVWNGGDDMIAAIQSERFVDAKSLIQYLKSTADFPNDLRLAVIRLDHAGRMSLADSRTAVAEIMHELKQQQTKDETINFAWGKLSPQSKLSFEFGKSTSLDASAN